MKILQPAGWAAPRGYVNGVAAQGTHVFVAGQIGWNARCEFESDDLVAQVRQALANVNAVRAAGTRLMRVYGAIDTKRVNAGLSLTSSASTVRP